MLTRIQGGLIYDPTNGHDGVAKDIWIRDDRIVEPPVDGSDADQVVEAAGKFAMAGGIDIHTHIGGGKGNIARMMMTEDSDANRVCSQVSMRGGAGRIAPSTFVAGYEYAKLGYTMCFEPAVLPSNARQAHMEMADTPMLDTGGYLVLGNDDCFLQMLASKSDPKLIQDYIAWMLEATQCIGVKAVNPGGISAFKFNQRSLDVDEKHAHYGVTPGEIVRAMTEAICELNISHPLHIHASNLGVPGNFESTLATIDAADGRPLHLAHVQFHSYGTEGNRGFSSAAQQICESVNASANVSVDVGHIMFGQTVTCSADTMHQFSHRKFASPRKATFVDIECEAGCGVVPFRYRSKDFVNALQWAIGLELFLSLDDPWRVFLTTDHPNGASFTTYPHLIRLLMDRSFRNDMLQSVNKAAASASYVADLNREYTLYEIAVITRSGPARSLGLHDRGHLGPGAVADIVLYNPGSDWEKVFRNPFMVIKDGQCVVRNGEVIKVLPGRTHSARLEYDRSVEATLAEYFQRHRFSRLSNFKISDSEMAEHIGTSVVPRFIDRAQ